LPRPRQAGPSLPWDEAHVRCHLPQFLTTLTTVAARDLLAAVPAGTGAMGAAVEAIKTVVCGALAGGEGSEAAVAV
jgi:hypothetical protein